MFSWFVFNIVCLGKFHRKTSYMSLSNTQIQGFSEKGFVVEPGLFGRDEIQHISVWLD